MYSDNHSLAIKNRTLSPHAKYGKENMFWRPSRAGFKEVAIKYLFYAIAVTISMCASFRKMSTEAKIKIILGLKLL